MDEKTKEPVLGEVKGFKSRTKLTINEILEYECQSSWLAQWVTWGWGQELLGRWFARKVSKKYRRYLYSIHMKNMIRSDQNRLGQVRLNQKPN